MVTKQVWITLQAGFWLQIFVEGNIYEKKIIGILLPFPYEIFEVTPLLAGCNTNNLSIPVVLPRNHPRDSNTRRRKNSNIATLNREPTITKNSSNTVLVYSWPTPFRLHQWRSEMCDFVCKYCFIHWDLAKRLYHRKPPPHLRVPCHCKEPYYRPSGWSRLVYYKKPQVQVPGIFTGSWFWNNVDVASADHITGLNHLSDCWHCQRHGYA